MSKVSKTVSPKKSVAKKKVAKKSTVKKKYTTVNEYIADQSVAGKTAAKTLRKLIQDTAPDSEEVISYNIPLYKQNGMLISFAVWKDHVGMYPLTTKMESAMSELQPYKGAKHSLKFSLDKPLPLKLITKVIRFRIKENES